GEEEVQKLEERGLGPGGAGVSRREGCAYLASELATLPEVARIVDPVLQLACHSAPVRRAEDQRVAFLQLFDRGLVQAPIAELSLRDAGTPAPIASASCSVSPPCESNSRRMAAK